MLSSVLNKSIFWQTHSQVVMNERQNKVLNIYIDGYAGKHTVKNWAKQAKVSADTAERDIKYLVDSGILAPQEGKVRNVAYGIRISKGNLYVPVPTDERD